MYNFQYHRPATIEEAKKILSGNEEAKLLGGGMTLLPTMKLRLAQPSDLVDLGGIESLFGIKQDGDVIEIGALTPHADVAASAVVRAEIPALAQLVGLIGDAQVRNRGTIGGSLSNSDPSADYPAAVLGLNGVIQTDEREIAADEYFKGLFETALQPREILQAVRFPKPARAAYAKFPNPASRYAIVGVMVVETADGIRVAVTGAGPCVFRSTVIEQALANDFAPAALDDLTIDAEDFNADMHASAEYRAHLVVVMAKRAVVAASG